MLIAEFDSVALGSVSQRLDDMIEDVARLHQQIPGEFVVWQTEDMNRRYPNIEESRESWITTWTTRIWPRSRLSDRRTAEQKRQQRQRGRRILFAPVARGGGERPILREELFEALRERMRVLLDAIKWTKK